MARTIEFIFKGDARDLDAALGGIQGESEKAGDSLEETGDKGTEGLDSVAVASKAAKVGMIAAAAAAAVLAVSMVKAVKATFDLTAQVNLLAKDARQVDMPVEELDAFQTVLDELTKGGISASRMFTDLRRGLAEAKDGAGPAFDALDKLDLKAEELAVLPLPEAMIRIADAMPRLADESDRAQVQMDLLGRAGKLMGPAMRDGGAGIRDAMERAKAATPVTAELALKSEALQDAALHMSRQFQELKASALEPLIPVLVETTKFVGELISDLLDTGIVQAFGRSIAWVAEKLLGLTGEVRQFKREVEETTTAEQGQIQELEEWAEKAADAEAQVRLLVGRIEAQQSAVNAAEKGIGSLSLEQERLTALQREFGDALLMSEAATIRVGRAEEALEATRQAEADAAAAAADEEMRLAQIRSRAAEEDAGTGGSGPSAAATDAAKAQAEERLTIEAERLAAEQTLRKTAAQEELALANETEMELDAIRQERADNDAARIEAETEARADAAEQWLEIAQQSASMIQSTFSQLQRDRVSAVRQTQSEIKTTEQRLADATSNIDRARLKGEIETMKKKEEKQKEQALAAFVIAKTAAVAEAAVSTALGVVNSLKVGMPAGAILAALSLAAGIAATVAIVATPPPSFHDGGLLGDEINIRARAGEVVVPPQSVRALGGPEGVANVAASGGGMGGDITVVQKLDHKVVDVQTHRAIQRTGSPLDSAIRSTNPRGTGRRDPYRRN